MDREILTTDIELDGKDKDEFLQAKELSAIARHIYEGEVSTLYRLLQTFRPYVCPFGEILSQIPAGSRVLDVGCGGGLLLLMLSKLKRLSSGYGFDTSAAAVSVANAAADRVGLSDVVVFEPRHPDEGIPQKDWSVITVIDVLHHIPTLAQKTFFEKICESVPPGGKLIVKDMVVRPYWRAFFNKIHDLVLARQLVNHVGPDLIEKWAADTGLRVIEHTQVNTFWYGHWIVTLVRDAGEH